MSVLRSRLFRSSKPSCMIPCQCLDGSWSGRPWRLYAMFQPLAMATGDHASAEVPTRHARVRAPRVSAHGVWRPELYSIASERRQEGVIRYMLSADNRAMKRFSLEWSPILLGLLFLFSLVYIQ